MQLRCGGIFSNHFITNIPKNVPVKKFGKSVSIFGEDVDKSLPLTFWGRLFIARSARCLLVAHNDFARSTEDCRPSMLFITPFGSFLVPLIREDAT